MDKMRFKSVIIYLVFIFILASLVVPYNNLLSKQQELENSDYSVNYFANSPDEFFNETQNPRYALVARPFGMIQYPNKANPCIIEFTEKFRIVVNGSQSSSEWNFTLHKEDSSQILNILSSNYVENLWYFDVIPSQMEVGLYDLQLNCSEGSDYQTHSVKIIEEKTYPFTFVQISDAHFPSYEDDLNTTDINLQEIENIKALNPDFVILTGDLIQGPTLTFLNPNTGKHMKGEVELKLALWALDTLDLPVYYIHGNHEFSQSYMIPDNLEENWYNYLGPIRYQNFTYLDWTMVGFGSSFEGLNAEEVNQIRNILSQNSDGATVLYYHYDFDGDATNFIRRYPIEVALYGHEHYEDLYLSENTLYHMQKPLFERGFTQFIILNETSLSINSEIYNFELLPYIPPTTSTPESTNYTLIASLVAIFTLLIKRKKPNVI